MAGIGHWLLGSADWHRIGWLLSCRAFFLGSYVSVRVPDGFLQLTLVPLIIVGSKLVF